MSERRLLTVRDLFALPDPSWLADFLIPQRSLSMLWGPPNVGKSFVALDFAASVATGNSWLGRDVIPGSVAYVAGEGVHSFKRRLTAWLRYNALAREDLSNLQFISWPVQLHEGIGTFMRVVEKIRPSLIVIDTLAASSLGIEESSNEGIGPVLESLLKIRKELETAVLSVHHTGWEEKHERGSSALRATMDTSIEITGRRIKEGQYDSGWKTNRKDKRRTLRCAKQRDAEQFRDIGIALREVRWKSRRGADLTSLVPEVQDQPQERPQSRSQSL